MYVHYIYTYNGYELNQPCVNINEEKHANTKSRHFIVGLKTKELQNPEGRWKYIEKVLKLRRKEVLYIRKENSKKEKVAR